jgi:DNA-binding IclR family transcriptional regulator
MSSTDYTNDGQQRILRLVNLLAGHEITGMAPSQIAQEQQCSPAIVTRDLQNLKTAGFAEQVPETNYWRLSPTIVQISLRLGMALDKAERKLDEVRNRFTRT